MTIPTAEAAFLCSRAHIQGRVTPLSEVLEQHWKNRTESSGLELQRDQAYFHEIGRQIYKHYLKLIEVSRGRMTAAGATAGEYLIANLAAKEEFKLKIQKMANELPPGFVRDSIIRSEVTFTITERDRARVEKFVELNGKKFLKEINDDKEFETLFSIMASRLYGAIGQLLVATLVMPEKVNQRTKSLAEKNRQTLFEFGFTESEVLREIDLVEELVDGSRTWSEVKFGGGRLAKDSRRSRKLIEQADAVRVIVEKLNRMGISYRHRIYLAFREVDPHIVQALVRLGAQVIVVDINKEFE